MFLGTGAKLAEMTLVRLSSIPLLPMLACWLVAGTTPAWAEPLMSPEGRAEQTQSKLPDSAEQPVDTLTWLQQEAHSALLDAQLERDRRAIIQQAWEASHPTWIQGSAMVNLGDFPALDDPTVRAEQNLKTLEWVIEEQRRAAAGQPRRNADDEEVASPDNWLRKLLPRHWIAALKANREWVAAGGTALLVVVWATAAFSRRPGPGQAMPDSPSAPTPTVRRRRRRRSASSAMRHASPR